MAKPFNSSHIQFEGQVFNETVLRKFGYGIYSNGTLSNSSRCYLVFDIYRPWMAPNGSVFNGTGCDSPINPIATRGALGIAFAALYAVVIIFVCVHLRKHGATHLPPEKRFRLVSRRWQWYWLLATCAHGHAVRLVCALLLGYGSHNSCGCLGDDEALGVVHGTTDRGG